MCSSTRRKLIWLRIWTVLLLASLAPTVGLVEVWIRSIAVRDRVVVPMLTHSLVFETFPHHFTVDIRPATGNSGEIALGLPQYPSANKYWQPRSLAWRPGLRAIAVPYWLPLMFVSAPMILAIATSVRHHRRIAMGQCWHCGYDLRESPNRCPECGYPVPAVSGLAAS